MGCTTEISRVGGNVRIVGSLLACMASLYLADCAQIVARPAAMNGALSYIDTRTSTVAIDRGMGVGVKGLLIRQTNDLAPVPFDYAWHPTPSPLLTDDDLFFATTLISTDTARDFDADRCYQERIDEIAHRGLGGAAGRRAVSDEIIQPILQSIRKRYPGLDDHALASARSVAWISAQPPAPADSAHPPLRTVLTSRFPPLHTRYTSRVSQDCKTGGSMQSLGGASAYFSRPNERFQAPVANRRFPQTPLPEFSRAIATPEILIRIGREQREEWLPFWSSVSDVEQMSHVAVAEIIRDARFLPTQLRQSERFAGQPMFFIVFTDVTGDLAKTNAVYAPEVEKADYLLAPDDILIMR